jgi:hypothetical protein
LASEASKFDKMIACHGLAEPKVALDVAKQLAPLIHDGRLEFVGMTRGGMSLQGIGSGKFEIRISKSETNQNVQNPNVTNLGERARQKTRRCLSTRTWQFPF